MKRITILLIAAVSVFSLTAFADNLGDLKSKKPEKRIAAAHYFGEKAETDGLNEDELLRLIELADDPNAEVRAAGRDAVMLNTNLELVEIWAERYITRGNYLGSFICYANAYYNYYEIYENTADAEVKAIFKSDRDKARLKAKEVYKQIIGAEKKLLAAPVYNEL
ncbi:MAG: hypothetical protein GY771_03795 [bacterium]|nr:hypothetical protein [bacterium]